MTLKDRIKRVIKAYREEIHEGRLDDLVEEIRGFFLEEREKKVFPIIPKGINHEKRFFFINNAQERLRSHPYNVSIEVTALVITEVIAALRRLKGETFEEFCQELWEISQITPEENKKNSKLI